MNPPPLSVSQLNQSIKQLLEGQYDTVDVLGEISNIKCYQSGHWYFTLKDESAEVSCVMFRGQNQRVQQPANGDKVRLQGRVSLYEPRGRYQIIASAMQASGEGALMLAYEKLKRQLQAEGLFDPERKSAIPSAPTRIALITSLHGAALHDMLTVLRRRSPQTEVVLVESSVQGEAAPAALIAALDRVQRAELDFDCVVMGRGGGSMEDLWAFNNEQLARAIVASDIPVISAVGHETDFTIADFVADQRAPTPSAAIELITSDAVQYPQRLQRIAQRLPQLVALRVAGAARDLSKVRLRPPTRLLQHYHQRIDEIERRLHSSVLQKLKHDQNRLNLLQGKFRHPGLSLRLSRQRLESVHRRLLQASPKADIDQGRVRLGQFAVDFQNAAKRNSRTAQLQLKGLTARLEAINPNAVLKRGYALLWDEERLVRSTAQTPAVGTRLRAQLIDGDIPIKVIKP